MNISYKWLKEYVDFELTPQHVAEALTSCGLEVGGLEEVQTIRGGLKGLYVGKVLTCEPHPNSDHLHITTVDLGKGEPQQIVCGAHNVAANQKVIVADLGCVLYDGDKEFVIKRSKLRGVESLGMICAEDEIGVGTSHDGIIVLPEDAPIGMPAAEYYNLESDWVIEVDITANRSDALSHYGVARDLYAWLKQNNYQTELHKPNCDAFKVDNESLTIDVEVKNSEACKRYACVSISNCEVKESPEWLQNKLKIVGIRPINNIVDITNYIMMAYGQPMHCFDADMVAGHKIVVATQPEGTKFITLDGEEHILSERDLSICNANEAMCIAGIFGGKGSGTYENTRNIVLESAYFHPTWIRKSARRHGLSTDASYRFERGIDPNGQVYALKQAAILCKELAGGQVSMQIKDVYPEPIEGSKVVLTYDYVNLLIGKEIGKDTIKSIVTSLDMKIEAENENQIELLIPAYRVDVKRPCDVVEDILRIYGYNNVEIPLQLKGTLTIPTDEDRNRKYINLISEQLVGGGFNEILNNSLTKVSYYKDLNCYTEETTVKILNPLSADLGVMRQTLLFGGLESIVRNANRKNSNLRFFEFGNCYHYDESKKEADKLIKAYTQDQHLGLWVTGKRVENSWTHPNEDASFYELKAYVENILVRLGLSLQSVTLAKGENNIFEDSISIVTKAGKMIAELGVVAYKLTKNMGITNEVFFADIYWDNLLKAVKKYVVEYKEISKYPAVSRDLALLVDKTVEFEQIKEIAYSTEKKLLKAVELFDVYEGKNLPEGKKSYAVNFILQDEQKTLNDKQIDSIMKKLIDNLTKRLNAELR
ncbi:phenylalanine--tRNA ligase subunit beta [Prevotella sp. oral taxon 299]|uniref:phenylalanine--tRNA ligase subunit beta n=1 Tax=Prevotella sp. oral taxon 299 TaxID=652716 RepID=UPI0001C3F58F|nr:phenylalanine--tRNA ligase subunit beta [Prevotella sp. oral taxon 299]EFC70342.1 phenylalanine-tRNA ligase, beta subunit [Prevotella sp. oral taxon 299 str. F0039]